MNKIYDISIPITNKTVVYPNNPAISIENFASLPQDSSGLTKITMGSHSGTHIDAPKHTIENGHGIDQFSLDKFIGDCYVYDFSYLEKGQGVSIKDFEKREPKEDEIVLIKTSNSNRDYIEFYSDFVYLDPDTATYLKNKKIKLFGIDYLSVKQKGSIDNRSHNEFLENNIPITEGLCFKDISEGEYQFIAMPLKFIGIDGSPTRAILLDKN